MKKVLLTTIVILGIALIGQVSTASANVLVNPGFESGLGSWFSVGDHPIYAAGWAARGGSTNGAVINAGGATAGTGYLLQEIAGVIPGDVVTFKGWSQGSPDAGTSNSLLKIEFWNGGVAIPSGDQLITHTGSYAWTQDTLVGYAPAGTTKAKVLFGATGVASAAGVFMFDDADATVIPEPTSMLLLGSGLLGLLGLGRKKK